MTFQSLSSILALFSSTAVASSVLEHKLASKLLILSMEEDSRSTAEVIASYNSVHLILAQQAQYVVEWLLDYDLYFLALFAQPGFEFYIWASLASRAGGAQQVDPVRIEVLLCPVLSFENPWRQEG